MYEVTQGLVLEPLLFNIHPLAHITQFNNSNYHNYADDIQIYLALSLHYTVPEMLSARAFDKLLIAVP